MNSILILFLHFVNNNLMLENSCSSLLFIPKIDKIPKTNFEKFE
jgi:hypothetical protein